MCDPVLIAAILEELGYFDEKDEKREKDKKQKVRDEGSGKEGLRESWGRIYIK
jgi:hypothetical protein